MKREIKEEVEDMEEEMSTSLPVIIPIVHEREELGDQISMNTQSMVEQIDGSKGRKEAEITLKYLLDKVLATEEEEIIIGEGAKEDEEDHVVDIVVGEGVCVIDDAIGNTVDTVMNEEAKEEGDQPPKKKMRMDVDVGI